MRPAVLLNPLVLKLFRRYRSNVWASIAGSSVCGTQIKNFHSRLNATCRWFQGPLILHTQLELSHNSFFREIRTTTFSVEKSEHLDSSVATRNKSDDEETFQEDGLSPRILSQANAPNLHRFFILIILLMISMFFVSCPLGCFSSKPTAWLGFKNNYFSCGSLPIAIISCFNAAAFFHYF